MKHVLNKAVTHHSQHSILGCVTHHCRPRGVSKHQILGCLCALEVLWNTQF